MNKYITEAKQYYKVAVDELAEASKNGKIKLAVDGCEKAWLALNLALKEMFVKKGVKGKELPRTYRGIVYFLVKYGDRETRNLFDEARNVLHINGFYDRMVIFERVDEVLLDIKEFIDTMC